MAPAKRRGGAAQSAQSSNIKEPDTDIDANSASQGSSGSARSEPTWKRMAKRCSMLLAGLAIRFTYDRLSVGWRTREERKTSELQEASCWIAFDRARNNMEGAPVLNETLLVWARRHGLQVRGGGIGLRDAFFRGLLRAESEERSPEDRVPWPSLEGKASGLVYNGLVLRLPLAMAIFMQPASHPGYVSTESNMACLGLQSEHESSIASLVLLLIAEVRRGSASLWAPYLRRLPSLDAFTTDPLLSADEVALSGNLSELIEDGREAFASFAKALAERPISCLAAFKLYPTYEEYMWARLVVLTRAFETTICGQQRMLTLIPVVDDIREASSSIEAELESDFDEQCSPEDSNSAVDDEQGDSTSSSSSSGACSGNGGEASTQQAHGEANARLVVPRGHSLAEEPWIEVAVDGSVVVGEELWLSVGLSESSSQRGPSPAKQAISPGKPNPDAEAELSKPKRPRWKFRRSGKGR